MRITELEAGGHELLLSCVDGSAGYRGFIAVHSTRLGPAVGGTRFWNYTSDPYCWLTLADSFTVR